MEADYSKGMQENTERLQALFEQASMLKSIPRKGWQEKLGLESPESVADHSYVTAFMATVYADIMGLDALRITRMSLMHDLAESITGDITPDSMPASEKAERESKAMSVILEMFPKEVRPKYEEAWDAYCRADSAEAVLLKQIDKLEMAMQARRYSHSTKGDITPFLYLARQKVRDPMLASMMDAIDDD